MVRRNASNGADLIKVMATGGGMTKGGPLIWEAQFSAAELKIVVDEAAEAGLRVAVHAHGVEGIANAVAAGVHTIEHCSWATKDGFDLRPELAEEIAEKGIFVCIGASPNWRMLPKAFGEERAAKLFDQARWMAEHGIRLIAGTDAGVPRATFDNFASQPGVLRAHRALPRARDRDRDDRGRGRAGHRRADRPADAGPQGRRAGRRRRSAGRHGSAAQHGIRCGSGKTPRTESDYTHKIMTLIVTGGSRGIGASIARLAAADGWDVCVSYLSNASAAHEVVQDCRKHGSKGDRRAGGRVGGIRRGRAVRPGRGRTGPVARSGEQRGHRRARSRCCATTRTVAPSGSSPPTCSARSPARAKPCVASAARWRDRERVLARRRTRLGWRIRRLRGQQGRRGHADRGAGARGRAGRDPGQRGAPRPDPHRHARQRRPAGPDRAAVRFACRWGAAAIRTRSPRRWCGCSPTRRPTRPARWSTSAAVAELQLPHARHGQRGERDQHDQRGADGRGGRAVQYSQYREQHDRIEVAEPRNTTARGKRSASTPPTNSSSTLAIDAHPPPDRDR